LSPILAENRSRYPRGWAEISRRIRFERAGGRCEWCGAEHGKPHPDTGSIVVLTVAHLDHRPENCDPSNLVALCQRCHNRYDLPERRRNAYRRRTAMQVRMFEEAAP
jgi:5-methylcytosine-specific restriction endonuclease McrA